MKTPDGATVYWLVAYTRAGSRHTSKAMTTPRAAFDFAVWAEHHGAENITVDEVTMTETHRPTDLDARSAPATTSVPLGELIAEESARDPAFAAAAEQANRELDYQAAGHRWAQLAADEEWLRSWLAVHGLTETAGPGAVLIAVAGDHFGYSTIRPDGGQPVDAGDG